MTGLAVFQIVDACQGETIVVFKLSQVCKGLSLPVTRFARPFHAAHVFPVLVAGLAILGQPPETQLAFLEQHLVRPFVALHASQVLVGSVEFVLREWMIKLLPRIEAGGAKAVGAHGGEVATGMLQMTLSAALFRALNHLTVEATLRRQVLGDGLMAIEAGPGKFFRRLPVTLMAIIRIPKSSNAGMNFTDGGGGRAIGVDDEDETDRQQGQGGQPSSGMLGPQGKGLLSAGLSGITMPR